MSTSNNDAPDVDRLRRAFVSASSTESSGRWSTETIRKAGEGELDPDTMAELAEAAADNEELRVALAVSVALNPSSETDHVEHVEPSPSRRGLIATVVALAAAACVLLIVDRSPPREDTPTFRGTEAQPISTRQSGGAVLSVDDPTLVWSSTLTDAEFSVSVSSGDGSISRDFAGLQESRLRLPAEFVEKARGRSLLWQVEARTASGDVYRSSVFEVRLR